MDKDSEKWWNEIFEELKNDTNVSDKFKYDKVNSVNSKVDKAFSDSDAKALNKVCSEAYKADSNKIKSSNSLGTDEYKESDVWKYCSGLKGKPKTIKDFDNKDDSTSTKYSGTNQIGKKGESDLISTKDPKNYKFWEIRDQEVKGIGSLFEKITISGSDSYFTNKDKTLRQLCEEAYGKNENTTVETSTLSLDNTKKYCSLSIG